MKIQPINQIQHIHQQYTTQQALTHQTENNRYHQYNQTHFTSDIKDKDTDTTLFHCDIYAKDFLDACRQMQDALKQREDEYRQQYPNGLKCTTIKESEDK